MTSDQLMMDLIQKLATNGVGFMVAAIAMIAYYKKDQAYQRLSSRMMRCVLSQTKDVLQQEQSIATIREVADKKRRAVTEDKEPEDA